MIPEVRKSPVNTFDLRTLVWFLICVAAVPAGRVPAVESFVRCIAVREPIVERDQRQCLFADAAVPGPRVDGLLDDAVWKRASVSTGFVEHQTAGSRPLRAGQTQVQAIYSDEALVLAVKCLAAGAGILRRECDSAVHDGDVFHDDCIEVVLVVASSEMRFGVSASGARADSLNGDRNWNPEWTSAASIGDKEWTAEISIPFSCLEGRRPPRPDDPGSSMRFNVCRSTAPVRLVSSRFPGYDDRARMGWLVVGTPDQWKARARMRPRVRFDDVALLLDKWAYDSVDADARGRLRLVGASASSDGPEAIRARLTVVGESGGKPLTVFESAPLTDAVMDFAIDVRQLPAGDYRLRAELLAGDDSVV